MRKVTLEGGKVITNVHDEGDCQGELCPVHNRSDHHMRSWPQNLRTDWGPAWMERICPHGIGHPDPDCPRGDSVHGCDGCCVPPGEGRIAMMSNPESHCERCGIYEARIEELEREVATEIDNVQNVGKEWEETLTRAEKAEAEVDRLNVDNGGCYKRIKKQKARILELHTEVERLREAIRSVSLESIPESSEYQAGWNEAVKRIHTLAGKGGDDE